MSYFYVEMVSPVGKLYLVSKAKALCAICFAKSWPQAKRDFSDLVKKETAILKKTRTQLQEYFAGQRLEFDLPIELQGTDFQKKVWKSLGRIPFGQTISYQDQAKIIKQPRAVRAVGRTNGLNPISIILPCHRVISKSGQLTGYAGGLDKKEYLLNHEKVSLTAKAFR